jgi:hypothetical protein
MMKPSMLDGELKEKPLKLERGSCRDGKSKCSPTLLNHKLIRNTTEPVSGLLACPGRLLEMAVRQGRARWPREFLSLSGCSLHCPELWRGISKLSVFTFNSKCESERVPLALSVAV